MLIFSTKLYVKDTLKDENFIEMAIKWVSGGPNYTFDPILYDNEEEYSVLNRTRTQKFTIRRYEDVVIIHLTNKDGKIIWTNDFILTSINGKRAMAVHLYNDAEDMSVKLPIEFNRPKLLKDIISQGYGEIDNDIETTDVPVVITHEKIEMISKLILQGSDYLMPIVYVTSTLGASSYMLNYNELAKDLAGVAHVIVEENNEISKQLKVITGGRNPYDGAVQIFYPNVGTQRILPKFYENRNEFRKEIAYSVFRRLIFGKMDDTFSVTKIKYNHLLLKNKKSAELEQIFNEILNENDKLVEMNNQRIEELEEENVKLKSKLMVYENVKNKQISSDGQNISVSMQEEELYTGEIVDVIIKIIKKEVKLMDSDSNLKSSRKYHILKDFLKNNNETGTEDRITNSLKEILNSDGSFNKSKKRKLIELGFEIEEGKHYKLKYKGDDRYLLTLAKTPGDYKANINAVQEIIRQLFKS